MIKKSIAFMLTLAITLSSLLAGCATKEEVKSDSKNESVEKQIIKFMSSGTSNEQASIDWIESIVDEFNATNEYNVEIQTEWYETEQYKTKLATLMTQNAAPDIFFTYEWDYLKNFVDGGKVEPITSYLNEDTAWKDSFSAGVFVPLTFDGDTYAVPTTQGTALFFYNKKIYEENGLEVPKTWDELEHNIKVLKDADVLPFSMGSQNAWVMGNMMIQFVGSVGGHELYNDISTGNTTWDDPRFIEAGKALQEFIGLGVYEDGFLGISYDEARQKFLRGDCAMSQQGAWDLKLISETMGDNVGAFFMPGYYPENSDTQISYLEKSYAISKTCANKEAAVEFLKLLTSEKNMIKLAEDVGAIPTVKVSPNEANMDPLLLDIIELFKDVNYTMTPMDRRFGANIGGEFNNISVAIAGGADPQEQFEWLAEYAKQEAQQ